MKANRNRMPAVILLIVSVLSALTFSGCTSESFPYPSCDTLEYTHIQSENESVFSENIPVLSESFDLSSVPEFSGDPFVIIGDGVPDFKTDELAHESYEYYGELDSLGRCTAAAACVGSDLMPNEKRESISRVKPTGWHSVKYDCVDGGNLYNRCHLIGFQLTGENANERNLITGTRFMNTEGMLPFENMTADFIKETDMHVMYRVTPIFDGNDLVARGVRMEAISVEDSGAGICFDVFVYNCQPGIEINYSDGESHEIASDSDTTAEEISYIINLSSKRFHLPSCSSAADITQSNRREYSGSREELINQGYVPCGRCKP